MTEWGPIKFLITKFMFPFLTFSYTHIFPNYGIAIILLTLLIKVIFIPLMNKQYKAMKSMQDIQPQLQRIREDYKDSPEQLQKELMQLYKIHGVNPLQGCLPMLVQIPFFIAIYATIASPLFKAEILKPGINPGLFPFWLSNLAVPDSYYVLPILVALLTYWTQKMVMVDPQQQKLIWLSPLLILAFGLKLPSGVLLYWAASTLLSGIQQLWIMNREPEVRVEIIAPGKK
jgi:YidC/Oxa1 family membrane protein insertase